MNIFIVFVGFVICLGNTFGAVTLQAPNYQNFLESNSSDKNYTLQTAVSRVGKGKIVELHLNPYDPISRIASQLWDHLFSWDRGKLRLPFNKPVPTTTTKPVITTLAPNNRPNWTVSIPSLAKPTQKPEKNTTTGGQTENQTAKPQEQTKPPPTVKPPPVTVGPVKPTLPPQQPAPVNQGPPQGAEGGAPQKPGYPPSGPGSPSQGTGYPPQHPGGSQQTPGHPIQGPGGPPQGPGTPVQGPGAPSQGPGNPSQGPGAPPTGPNYPPSGPGGSSQFPGQGPPHGNQQPPGYPHHQQPPGQFNPNQQMPPGAHPGGPFTLNDQLHRLSTPMGGYATQNLQMHLIQSSSSPHSGESSGNIIQDTVSIMLPSNDDETESYEKNEILPFQRNKTALLLHENPEVYSTKSKPGILLHFGDSANPMKSQLQFYISPDFSLFIKPSMIQSKYGMKKKSSSFSKLSSSFINHRENLQPETFEDIKNPESLSENPAPSISKNFSEGIAYLIEMISKLASVTSNFHNTLPEKVESDIEPETTESSIESEELDDTNVVEGFVDIDDDYFTQNISISTTNLPSELLVNETLLLQTLKHNDANQATHLKDDSEVMGNQSQVFAIKADVNLGSIERENNTQVYYSIIGPKNITYIDVDSNGQFEK